MKAEERKELKQNALVATLEKVKGGFKEGPSRRTVVTVGIIALLLLLYGIWKLASSISEGRNSARWEILQDAVTQDDLKQLTDKNADTVQGRAARLQIARDELRDGLVEIYDQYENARKKLSSAADAFEKLAKDFKATPILVQECLYGAGQARESLGELDSAIALYESVGSGKQASGSLLAEQAAKDAQRVKDKKSDLDKIQQQLKKP